MRLKAINSFKDLAIIPINEVLSQEVEALEIIRGKEYQTPLPTHRKYQISKIHGEDQADLMHSTIDSEMSYSSKYLNDGARTVHNLHSGTICQGAAAYDSIKQKSLLDISIRTGQSIEELLESNSQIANLLESEKSCIN